MPKANVYALTHMPDANVYALSPHRNHRSTTWRMQMHVPSIDLVSRYPSGRPLSLCLSSFPQPSLALALSRTLSIPRPPFAVLLQGAGTRAPKQLRLSPLADARFLWQQVGQSMPSYLNHLGSFKALQSAKQVLSCWRACVHMMDGAVNVKVPCDLGNGEWGGGGSAAGYNMHEAHGTAPPSVARKAK